jgi:hypothetical protein
VYSTTSHNGYAAPTIDPSPPGINLTPQVLRALLHTKLRKANKRVSRQDGSTNLSLRTNHSELHKTTPAMICLMAATCKAETPCLTVQALATQVVPHNMHTATKQA